MRASMAATKSPEPPLIDPHATRVCDVRVRPTFDLRCNVVGRTGRYTREADAIVRELGVRSFIPFEDGRVAALVDERLRLALSRTRLPRLRSDELVDLLEL